MPRESEEEDARLLARVAAGDEAAFTDIYRRYLPLVLRWSLRQTGNREVAADLTAEVFAASLRASRRFRPGESTVGAWLLGIAANKLRDSYRRRTVEDSARRRLGLDVLAIDDEAIERIDEIVSLTDEALGRAQELPPDQRDAVLWHVVSERSYAEIASELRCSESVVRQRVSRGLRTLRSQMEDR